METPGRGVPYPVRDKTARETAVSWWVLVLSGVLEAVWATALSKSESVSRVVPSLVFLVALALSMAGLAYAMRELSVGTSYAVWVGIGAALTRRVRDGDYAESAPLKLVFFGGIVGSAIGLKLTH